MFKFIQYSLIIGSLLGFTRQAFSEPSAEACDLKKVQFQAVNASASHKTTGKFKGTQITLDSEPSIPKSPSPTFDLPMQVVTKTGKSCKLGVGNWDSQEIYINKAEDLVAGSECSGSGCTLTFYALSDCAKRDSILFAGPMRLEGRRLLLKGACEYLDEAKIKAYCSPAKIYDLESACKPRLDEKESLIWTKKIYGVEFSVPSNITNVHSPRAQVTKP